jgi:hypothetical protein
MKNCAAAQHTALAVQAVGLRQEALRQCFLIAKSFSAALKSIPIPFPSLRVLRDLRVQNKLASISEI